MSELEIFNNLVNTINTKKSWQDGRRLLYDGGHKATMIKIAKDPRVDAHVNAALDWPRIAVDHLVSDCTFDAFENDSFGVTRLLVEAGGDSAILSAQTNATIGAVSFVAIIPRANELPILVPFSGAEATGVKTARGNELAYGLAIKKRENGRPSEYYFFEPGFIHVLDAQGAILDSVDLGIKAMPFIQFTYDPDDTNHPFGRSRFSQASINILDSALRSIDLSEKVSLINLLKGDLLMVSGTPERLQSSEEFKAAVGTLKTMWFDGLDLNGVKLEQLDTIELKEVEKSFTRAVQQFAASMSMMATAFGLDASNGSHSEGTTIELKKPYEQTLTRTRNSFGASIKLLATELFKIVAQTENVSGLSVIDPTFIENVKPERLAGIGDGFSKITAQLQALNLDIEIPASYVRKMIGIPLRPRAINQELPNFESSSLRFREISIDGV